MLPTINVCVNLLSDCYLDTSIANKSVQLLSIVLEFLRLDLSRLYLQMIIKPIWSYD